MGGNPQSCLIRALLGDPSVEMGEAGLPPDLIGNLGEIPGRPLCRSLGQIVCHLIASHALVSRDQKTVTLFCLAMRRVHTFAAPLAHCWPGPRSSDEMRRIAD